MFKRMILGLLLVIAVTTAVIWYRAAHNTPQAIAKSFAGQLAEGKADDAYRHLTADLTKGRESYWRDYLKQFASQTPPELDKEETVTDTFNTYTDRQDPHRFTYTFRLEDADYRMVMLLVKEGKAWKVAELHGSMAR